MTKVVFRVRVISKDVLSDSFARFKSIIGGRIRGYERAIESGLEDLYHELILEFPNIKNIRFGTTEMLNDACELILYGEVSDEEYKKYILEKRRKQKR